MRRCAGGNAAEQGGLRGSQTRTQEASATRGGGQMASAAVVQAWQRVANVQDLRQRVNDTPLIRCQPRESHEHSRHARPAFAEEPKGGAKRQEDTRETMAMVALPVPVPRTQPV